MDAAFRNAVAAARRKGELFFAGLLSEDRILQAFGKARWKSQGWIYTPAATVWTFLSQCLSPDHSCRDAVARLMAWRLAQGMSSCSAETGAYCTARGQLPEETCSQLMRDTGSQLDDAAPDEWLWLGHRVLDVDGSTITMPDTEANQAEYPQQRSQAPGCGFPIARIVVIFSLAVGAVLDAAIGKYQGKQTGENSLFRTLHGTLRTGDVVLADRYFGGWFDMALVKQQHAEVVIRKHQLRATDFRLGVRLGPGDQLVCWRKPARPEWMSRKQYASLPEVLTLREVRIEVHQRGFRTRTLVVVTTLLDAEKYPASEIAALYRRRWQAELHLRSLKVVLQMGHLRCKTPERVRNEFYMHLVAYNLIRELMATAAFRTEVSPWTVSFKGALQTINNLAPLLTSKITTDEWCERVLKAIATHEVGNRPDRVEPRVVKRRPKPYKLMTQPRADYKRHAA